jgi:hypothetical protein
MNKLRWLGAVCTFFIAVLSTSANAALIQAFQGTGNYGLEVTALGFGGSSTNDSITNGTLNLASYSGSAMAVQAYLYAYDSNNPGTVTGSFNGQSLLGGTAIGPNGTAAGFATLYSYRWDVTNLMVPGVTNYSWSFAEVADQFNQQGHNISMAVLAVVYSDLSLPTSTATIIDGMEYIGITNPDTKAVSFLNLPAGSNKLYAATYFDDGMNTGETISFNGSLVGGPLDKNLSLNGSLTQMSGTSATGTNVMSITTGADQFGWGLAAALTTPVPIPPALWLFGSGLLGLIGIARRKKAA